MKNSLDIDGRKSVYFFRGEMIIFVMFKRIVSLIFCKKKKPFFIFLLALIVLLISSVGLLPMKQSALGLTLNQQDDSKVSVKMDVEKWAPNEASHDGTMEDVRVLLPCEGAGDILDMINIILCAGVAQSSFPQAQNVTVLFTELMDLTWQHASLSQEEKEYILAQMVVATEVADDPLGREVAGGMGTVIKCIGYCLVILGEILS